MTQRPLVTAAIHGVVPPTRRPQPRDVGRCRWCGRPFEVATGPGRPREYCRRSCRQRDYEARRRAAELGLGESELIVARAELDELRDHLYELEAAMADADQDLDAVDQPGERDYREALEWVLAAARPLVALRLAGTGVD